MYFQEFCSTIDFHTWWGDFDNLKKKLQQEKAYFKLITN